MSIKLAPEEFGSSSHIYADEANKHILVAFTPTRPAVMEFTILQQTCRQDSNLVVKITKCAPPSAGKFSKQISHGQDSLSADFFVS